MSARKQVTRLDNGHVVVRRAQSRAFFCAVLAAWAEATGRDKSMFRHADAVTVPPEVVAAARHKLAENSTGAMDRKDGSK